MQTIKKESLKKGMKFSAPVFFDDGKYMFLAEHKPVAQFHLNAMSRWKIPYVITHGKVADKTDHEKSDHSGNTHIHVHVQHNPI